MTAARQRLKSNLGALALLTFARNLFTPYLYLRGQIIRAVDWFSTSSRTHRGIDVVWYIGECHAPASTDTRNCDYIGTTLQCSRSSVPQPIPIDCPDHTSRAEACSGAQELPIGISRDDHADHRLEAILQPQISVQEPQHTRHQHEMLLKVHSRNRSTGR